MKTIAVKTIVTVIFLYAVLSIMLSYGKQGDEITEAELKDQFEHFFEQEELFTHIEDQLQPDFTVRIYKPDGEPVASGIEKEEKIKNLLRKSTHLTEVNGTGYFLYEPR